MGTEAIPPACCLKDSEFKVSERGLGRPGVAVADHPVGSSSYILEQFRFVLQQSRVVLCSPAHLLPFLWG